MNMQVGVSGNELGQAGGEAMAAALRANNTLETLEIGNVVVGAKVKVKSSSEIKVVQSFEFNDSRTAKDHIKVEGSDGKLNPSEFELVPAVLPLKQLRENTVTELNFSNSGLGVDGGIMLAAVLEGNQSVQWVDASGNALGNAGAKAFGDLLLVNKTILHLNVSANGFGEVQAGDQVKLKDGSVKRVLSEKIR